MKKLPFKKIDAFATSRSDGNPAGYVRLTTLKDLTEEEMLRIAKELKGYVNEVGYIAQTGAAGFDLRYYSSEREVDFCGHATVAILYDVLNSHPDFQHREVVLISTNRGTLTVQNRLQVEDAVFIMSPKPVVNPLVLGSEEIAKGLEIPVDWIDRDADAANINAGLNTLLVPIKRLSDILAINPNRERLEAFCVQSDIDIIEVFTEETTDPRNDYRVRVFAPTFGYLEDPATGSGNSALGYHLMGGGLFQKTTLRMEQNSLRERFNLVKLQKQRDETGNDRVFFGGGAQVRIAGEYYL